MVKLSREQFQSIESILRPEKPGPLIGQHILHTGIGDAYADCWPGPGGLLLEVAGNYTLFGNPDVFSPGELQAKINGFLDAPDDFKPLIDAAFPEVFIWKRIIYSLADLPNIHLPSGIRIMRLTSHNFLDLQMLNSSLSWITKTWGGAAGLAGSTRAWGAFLRDKLVSVACPFFVGKQFEDIGVITEPDYRNQGINTACAGELCPQILQSGKQVSWSTSLDNVASRRVAEKLGFKFARLDQLYVIGIDIP